MIEYVSTKRHESKIDPDVVYVLHRLNTGQRIDLRVRLAPVAAKLRDLFLESVVVENRLEDAKSKLTPAQREEIETRIVAFRQAVKDGQDVAPVTLPSELGRLGLLEGDEAARLERDRQRLFDAIALVRESEMHREWIRWAVHSIEGVRIDGEPATAENVHYGPDNIYQELLAIVEHELGFTEEALKNSASPSISGEPAAGESPSTNAPIAAV